MRDIINATLGNDHVLNCSTFSIARNGEGLTPCLSISIPENLCKYWAYLDFKKPNGETFKTPRIDVSDGKIEYNLPHALLDVEGKLEVQVIFQNENNEIWKSYVKEFIVRYSINAADDIPDKQDFITEAQNVLDEVVETANSLEERANNGEFKGDKGDKGDAGAIKFMPVAELPTENIDESAIYLVPSNNAQDNNTFDEYVYIDGAWEKIGSASVEINLDKYLKKPTTTSAANRVVMINNNTLNENYMDATAKLNRHNQIPISSTNGTLYIGEPTESKHAATKGYVDENFLPLNTTADEWGYNRIYAVDGKGNQTFLNALAGQGANRIQISDGYGCLKVASPRADNDVANKKYVDDAIAQLKAELLGGN